MCANIHLLSMSIRPVLRSVDEIIKPPQGVKDYGYSDSDFVIKGK